MKKIYLMITLCALALGLVAQPVFNWSSQEIKPTRNLQKMTVQNNQAVIAGYGRTFVRSTDNGATWNDLGLLSTTFDFIGMNFKGINGYLVASRSKLHASCRT